MLSISHVFIAIGTFALFLIFWITVGYFLMKLIDDEFDHK